MKTSVCYSAFFALLSLILSPLAVIYASASPPDNVHFNQQPKQNRLFISNDHRRIIP